MFNFRVLFSILCLLLPLINYGQFTPPQNWVHFDKSYDGFYGIASDRAYNELLKDETSTPVIVAVLDSGIDIYHEDLKSNIWVNHDEIPENGIDDDNNGYIDDINGWNFIGGRTGDVHHETYEVTRLYAQMMDKYEGAELESMTPAEKKEYSKFVRYKEEVEKKRNSAQQNFDQINYAKRAYNEALLSVKEVLARSVIEKEDLDNIPGTSQNQLIGRNILKDIMSADDMDSMDIDTLLVYINSELDAELHKHEVKLKYAYNPKYNSRDIVGDNLKDPFERSYGNSNVKGPDALHGTHVAGTIGAIRNNDIGMNGIANNIKLMSVRVVPDGDERDKDVANAIRYAVDNGASVINMSFGKGHSPNKKLVDEAVKYAQKHDVLIVHAAGNGSADNDADENFPNDKYQDPSGFWFWKVEEAKNWIEVGALSYMPEEYMIAPFSNFGAKSVDIFAPGMGVYATTPEDKYQFLQGTSMASPVVAGAAAVLRSHFPTLDAIQVKDILMKSVTKVNQEVLKPGFVDKKVPFSQLCVSGGILNLYEAIKLAKKSKGNKKPQATDSKV